MKPFVFVLLLALIAMSFATRNTMRAERVANLALAEPSISVQGEAKIVEANLKGLQANIGLAENMVRGIQSAAGAGGSGGAALAAGHKICITYESPGGHKVTICWESSAASYSSLSAN